ncbi:MAG: class I SAM-dependent DNA methyltransferase [Limisphaerales bacterium]
MNTLGDEWASKLGLSSQTLFLNDSTRAVLRDGVWGSFVLGEKDVESDPVVDWTWSAYARHHVRVEDQKVGVTNIAKPSSTDWFSRRSVETQLEDFYVFLRRSARQPSVSVVDHLSGLLHAHLAESAKQNVPRPQAFLLFLALLEREMEQSTVPAATASSGYCAFSDQQLVADLLGKLADHVNRFQQELAFCKPAARRLHTGLTLRHASGVLFQSAHYIVESEPQGTLWGLPSAKGVLNPAFRGVHYTPVSLARVLVAMTLRDLVSRVELSVLDPTCGSGVFLVETLYELERRGFKGTLRLIGVDVSETAVIAARFSVAYALRQGISFRVEPSFHCGDALEVIPTLRPVDCAIMNPPFVSWERLKKEEQTAVKNRLGAAYCRRPDLAMVLMGQALERVAPGGRLACVLPVGVMTGDSAKAWREGLSGNRMVFDGVLADHQLFEEATVSVGAVVLEKTSFAPQDRTTLLWADNQPSSSDDALRHLKQAMDRNVLEPRITDNWGVFDLSQKALCAKGSWRPPSGRLSQILERLASRPSRMLGESFVIRLGIRTGNRAAFVVDAAFVERLSSDERHVVRPIAESSNIVGGHIVGGGWVIMIPSDLAEEELLRRFPKLYAHLVPFRAELAHRSSLPRGAWWTLSRARDLHESSEPRLVSKAFFRREGFAVDFDGHHAVVTGYTWLPLWSRKRREFGELDHRVRSLKVLLNVLDSDVFYLLAREHSSLVSGGQVDLAPAQIDRVPFPTFHERWRDSAAVKAEYDRMSAEPLMLAGEYLSLGERNALAAEYYGVALEEWPLLKE